MNSPEVKYRRSGLAAIAVAGVLLLSGIAISGQATGGPSEELERVFADPQGPEDQLPGFVLASLDRNPESRMRLGHDPDDVRFLGSDGEAQYFLAHSKDYTEICSMILLGDASLWDLSAACTTMDEYSGHGLSHAMHNAELDVRVKAVLVPAGAARDVAEVVSGSAIGDRLVVLPDSFTSKSGDRVMIDTSRGQLAIDPVPFAQLP